MIDYLILGQGICGSWMAHYLQKEGKKVMVIDNQKEQTASRIASGVINPVTGRRVVKTWMIDEIMSVASEAYQQFQEEHQANIIQQIPILNFHASLQMKEAHDTRLPQQTNFLHEVENQEYWLSFFRFKYGITEVSPAWLIDMQCFLEKSREALIATNSYLQDSFSWEDCTITEDSVEYKGIKAQKIICCDGAMGTQNPYFQLLPFAKNKGEVLICSIPGLPRNNLYKQGITITPWKEYLFWVGSSYEWNYSDDQPSAAFRIKTELQMQQWLNVPYRVHQHLSAIRPANVERRPFVGIHPHHPAVAILNGMGTKGCSLSPYFAQQLTQFLINGTPIAAEADVNRFTRVLSR